MKFTDEEGLNKLLKEPQFASLEELDDGIYQVASHKKIVNLNLPINIGFFVYQVRINLYVYYTFIANARCGNIWFYLTAQNCICVFPVCQTQNVGVLSRFPYEVLLASGFCVNSV